MMDFEVILSPDNIGIRRGDEFQQMGEDECIVLYTSRTIRIEKAEDHPTINYLNTIDGWRGDANEVVMETFCLSTKKVWRKVTILDDRIIVYVLERLSKTFPTMLCWKYPVVIRHREMSDYRFSIHGINCE